MEVLRFTLTQLAPTDSIPTAPGVMRILRLQWSCGHRRCFKTKSQTKEQPDRAITMRVRVWGKECVIDICLLGQSSMRIFFFAKRQ